MKIWGNMKHPNILPVIGFHLDRHHTTAWLISPWEDEGNLSAYVRRTKPDEKTRLQLVSVTYLDSNPSECPLVVLGYR